MTTEFNAFVELGLFAGGGWCCLKKHFGVEVSLELWPITIDGILGLMPIQADAFLGLRPSAADNILWLMSFWGSGHLQLIVFWDWWRFKAEVNGFEAVYIWQQFGIDEV